MSTDQDRYEREAVGILHQMIGAFLWFDANPEHATEAFKAQTLDRYRPMIEEWYAAQP